MSDKLTNEMVECPTCSGKGVIQKPVPPEPYYPSLAEGARFLHDCKSCVFLGQYEDADLYVCANERLGVGNEYGAAPGRYGNMFKLRFTNAKRLGSCQILSGMSVERASKTDDPYFYAAYQLVKEGGWVLKPDRPSRVECVFIPDKP